MFATPRPMLPCLLLLACSTPPESSDDTSTEEVPLEHQFSFVVIADPHISGNAEHTERLEAAVEWIEANRESRRIEVVTVVGDIGWGEGLATSRAVLDSLSMPYLPVIGDNEVHFETGKPFDDVFGPVIDGLATDMSGERGPVEVYNTVYDKPSWMQNYALQHRGLHFVALDWASRNENNLLSELGELHDFEDGTFPWFSEQMSAHEPGEAEDILLFSHHAMHLGPFDLEALGKLTGVTGPVGGRVAGNWAGHYHFDYEERIDDGGYDVWVTDATWDDENTVRLVEVHGNGSRYEYVQELIVVE